MTPTVTVTAAGESATATYGGRQLAWSDEFTGLTVDRTKWNVRTDSQNNHYGYNLPANVTVQPDGLHIRAQRQAGLPAGKLYSTGYLDTAGHFTASTGRWEIQARLPTFRGAWPALWLRNANLGEIDILEAVGGLPHMVVQTVHQSTVGDQDRCGFDYENAAFDPTQLHTYAFERDADGSVRWYIDGTLTVGHKPADISTKLHQPMGWLAGPEFATPFHVRLQLQVGGTMPVYYQHDVDATSVLPDDFVIRSVRYYR